VRHARWSCRLHSSSIASTQHIHPFEKYGQAESILFIYLINDYQLISIARVMASITLTCLRFASSPPRCQRPSMLLAASQDIASSSYLKIIEPFLCPRCLGDQLRIVPFVSSTLEYTNWQVSYNIDHEYIHFNRY
jgi:hypothetical protein